MHDLPLIGPPPRQAQLQRDPGSSAPQARSRHERIATVAADELEVVDGISVSTVARALVDFARAETLRAAVVAADAALRRGLARSDLLEVASRCAAWPNGLQGLWVARFADGLAESALESMSRVACHELGLPAPELQIEVFHGEQLVARVDHLWRATNTIGQSDGAVKYDSRADVLRDKHQDEQLESLGFEVVRWGWDQAYRPRGVLDARLERGFVRGARQQIDPRVRLVTATIAQNLAKNARWAG